MKSKNLVLSKKFLLQKTEKIVEYLLPEEVYRIAESIKEERNGERDSLLILLLFETGLRISEALSLTPRKTIPYNNGYVLHIKGKGNKIRMVACPEELGNKLKAYAYDKNLSPDERFWKFNRTRAWQIIKKAAKKAGINKRVYPHLFRHSDAIYRLKQTGNPKALQLHLGHSSMMMTMRYLNTLSAEDAIRIQQQVKFKENETD